MSIFNFILTSSFALTGAEIDASQVVSAPVTTVDIPAMIEEKSSVQFEVVSEFPNDCYGFGPVSLRVDRDRNVILFHVSAFEQRASCPPNPTLMSKIVHVGRLPQGSYEVRELKSLKKWGNVEVQHFDLSADLSPRTNPNPQTP
jgi:hypothetical protein